MEGRSQNIVSAFPGLPPAAEVSHIELRTYESREAGNKIICLTTETKEYPVMDLFRTERISRPPADSPKG